MKNEIRKKNIIDTNSPDQKSQKRLGQKTAWTPEEYFEFCLEHGVYGARALELKKELDMKSYLLEPKLMRGR